MRYVSDFIDEMKFKQNEIALSLAQGGAADFLSYQRLIGEYAGLQTSLDILNNLLKEEDNER